MSDEFSPFALNMDNMSTYNENEVDEQTQEEIKLDLPTELKLDLPTNEDVEPAFESVKTEARRKVTPEEQAQALLDNWLTANPNAYPTGHQKHIMYRAYLRNAKKGRYNRIFNPEN